MKNLKKVLSVVLALSMVLSTFTVAFADTETETNAETLYDLGLFDGVSAEEYVPNLEGTATREQAMKMIAVALDWDVDMDAVSQFADVSDWAQPYVATAVEMGVTNGVSEDEFAALELVTARQIETFFDRVITGSTTAWEDNAGLDNTAGITRGYLVDVTYAALMQTAAGEETTLIEAIVADDEDLVEIAVEAGLIEADEDVAVGIKSVTTNGLKQIVIEYTTAIDDAGDEDNYDVDADTAELDDDSDFDLSDDGKTVTITLTTAADQQEEVDFEIEDMTDEDVTFEDFQFIDTTIPEVTGVEVVGVDTVKVYFSEPMNDTEDDEDAFLLDEDNYEVYDADGDEIDIDNVTAGTNNMYALVELDEDLDDDVTVIVDDVEDYAGLAVLETEIAVAVTVDDDAPEVIGYDDTSIYEVTLIFDEDIEVEDYDEDDDDPDADVDFDETFYHTNTNNEAYAIEVDGNELTLYFSDDDSLPEGTAYIYIESDMINDLWDNYIDDIEVEVEIDADEDAPEVDGDVDVDVDSDDEETVITVYFDEEVYAEDDDFEATIVDEDDDDYDYTDINVYEYDDYFDDLDEDDVDDDMVTEELEITFDEEFEAGDYTLTIEGIVDVYGNQNDDIEIEFTIDDEISPETDEFVVTLYSEDSDDEQLLVIDFYDEMDEDYVTDLSLYSFDDEDLEDYEDYIDVELTNDGETVEITLDIDELTDDEETFAFASGEYLEIGYMADAEGNYMDAYSKAVLIDDGATETVAVDDAELTDVDTIEVTLDAELDDVDEDSFTFYDLTDGVYTEIAVTDMDHDVDDDDGVSVLTFTLDDDYSTDVTTNGGIFLEITDGEDAGETEYGVYLAEYTYDDSTAVEVEDGIAPEVENIYVYDYANADGEDDTYDVILIEFSEDLDSDMFSNGESSNGFDVSGGDADLGYAELYSADADIDLVLDTNWVIIHCDDDDEIFTEDTNVSYDDASELGDLEGNEIDDFSETDEMDEF